MATFKFRELIININTVFHLHPLIILGGASVFFLAIGSFLNVVIYRWPRLLHASWTAQCQVLLDQALTPSKAWTFWQPRRSCCPHCHQLIPAWHNLPLISYLYLRGRCARCQGAISWRYPAVELLCLVLSLGAVYRFGLSPLLSGALVFLWVMLCIFFIDLEHQIIPDGCSLSLLWLGLLLNTQHQWTSLPDAVYAASIAYVSLWLFIHGYAKLTGKIGMGNGDFKLFAALGAWFGCSSLLGILMGASLLGAVIGLAYLKRTQQGRDTPIPFGPFLCVAGVVKLFL